MNEIIECNSKNGWRLVDLHIDKEARSKKTGFPEGDRWREEAETVALYRIVCQGFYPWSAFIATYTPPTRRFALPNRITWPRLS